MRRAVQRFVSAKRLQPVAFMGEGLDGPWLLRDGRRVEEREAVACEARVVCLSVRVSQWFSIVFNCFQVVSSGFKVLAFNFSGLAAVRKAFSASRVAFLSRPDA